MIPYIYKNSGKFKAIFCEGVKEQDYSGLKLTIDTKEVYELISKIYDSFRYNLLMRIY